MGKQLLQEQDYQNAANIIHCEIACIKSVASVESSGKGFYDNDLPVILFEAAVFSRLTNHQYDKQYPNISSPVWNKALYYGKEREYLRLVQAKQLNETAALESTSWGKFQIMGSNYKQCGYQSVQDMVRDAYDSEHCHLIMFIMFLKSTGLDKHLVQKDWKGFAQGYNGSGYAKNQYNIKLQQAYNKFKGIK